MDTLPSNLTTISTGVLREVYLERLRRLQHLRQRHESDLNMNGLRLLDRSVFAAYCDCRDAGAGEEARQVLEGASCVLEQSEDSLGDAGRPAAEEQS